MQSEVMSTRRHLLANTNLAIQTNYTGNDRVDISDLVQTIQTDLKGLFLNYNKSQNTFYSALVKTSAYTCTSADSIIFVDTTSSAVTITLPTAVGIRGKTYTIKDWAANASVRNITIAATGGQTIDGTTLSISADKGSYTVCSDNANWFIIGKV